MALQTYTITTASFEAEAGENISSGANPTVTLVISPIEGYNVASGNFSIGEPLPAEIDSVVFSQNGANVNALVTFASGFVMPSSDVELLIDIDGVATQDLYTITGSYSTVETNTTSASTNVAFSESGNEDDTVTLFTKTFTAASGYYFETPPYYYQSQGAARNESNYIIERVDTTIFGNTPEIKLLTASAFTVKYLIGALSETLNDLNFIASAVEIFAPPATDLVKSYVVNTKAWLPEGGTKTVTFYGDPGATFTFTIDIDGFNDGGTSYVLEDSGSLSIIISAGANSSGSTKVYTYTLSGNIESPFAQDNPFIINQPSS